MKRRVLLFAVLAALVAASPASAEFGFKRLDVTFTAADGSPQTEAGTHPFAMTTDLDFNTVFDPDLGEGGVDVPDGAARNLFVDLPPGLIGNPTATPRCSGEDFATIDSISRTACPDSTAVGVVDVELNLQNIQAPVYNLVPTRGVAAKFGFVIAKAPVTFEAVVNPNPPHNVVASVTGVTQVLKVYGSSLTLWGNPGDPAHDDERGNCRVLPGPLCPTNAPKKPFLTLPRSCTGPLSTLFRADSWESPGAWVEKQALTNVPVGTTGCDRLGLTLQIDSRPTTERAESASGLDFDIDIEDEGLTSPGGRAQSDVKEVHVALPEGITLNPSAANGLAACTPADYGREAVDSEPGAGCPEAAKVGSIEVETPLLEDEVLQGSVYVAQQDDPATVQPGAENPFDSTFAMYLVIRNRQLGVLVKQAGEVRPDPVSGQLESSFREVPQVPFSRLRFRFRSGPRAPLVTPPSCGLYTTEAEFTPWANPGEPVLTSSSFEIARGIGGAGCPAPGPGPFDPAFVAGSIDKAAGAYSPFYLRFSRRDGEQEMLRFSSSWPPGLVAKLAGVAKCPDAAIAAARGKTGRQELADPSCPASSRIGRTLAGAGVGSELTYVPGDLYMAGPVGDAPLSVVAITPAVAGPFDVGTVAVREALQVDRTTAAVYVDADLSDPFPRILAGVPLRLRDLRAYLDREDFVLNPTNCKRFQLGATLFGSSAAAPLSSPFQVAGCRELGFRPRLSLRLKGKTKRSGNPSLRAILRTRPGDANIGRASVTLPHSAFLDQAHIRTICTRVQFAADRCPPGSIYGRARAVTPLLDEPLKGPVYLRSSDNELPDLVAALHGEVDVDVVGRIDSKNGGIRTTFETVPDAPVTKFVLDMQGGEKGLIENSRNLCRHQARATVEFTGQNGRVHGFRPLVKPDCGKGKKPRPRR